MKFNNKASDWGDGIVAVLIAIATLTPSTNRISSSIKTFGLYSSEYSLISSHGMCTVASAPSR